MNIEHAWTSIRKVKLNRLIYVVVFFLLGACGESRSIVGLNKQSPNEFEVITRAPLSLPPNYSLRVPAPGKQRPQEKTIRSAARDDIVQSGREYKQIETLSKKDKKTTSPGEAALLSRAEALDADNSIREKISSESNAMIKANKDLFDKLLFWKKAEKPGVVIDQIQEAKRIREARAKGKLINEGEVPSIKRKKRGFLEGIF